MSIRIFKSVLIRQQLSQQELDDLAADFLSHKKDGVSPDTFGCDEAKKKLAKRIDPSTTKK